MVFAHLEVSVLEGAMLLLSKHNNVSYIEEEIGIWLFEAAHVTRTTAKMGISERDGVM